LFNLPRILAYASVLVGTNEISASGTAETAATITGTRDEQPEDVPEPV